MKHAGGKGVKLLPEDMHMARLPRREVIDEREVAIYHCVNRCVRRAFLCGHDALAGGAKRGLHVYRRSDSRSFVTSNWPRSGGPKNLARHEMPGDLAPLPTFLLQARSAAAAIDDRLRLRSRARSFSFALQCLSGTMHVLVAFAILYPCAVFDNHRGGHKTTDNLNERR